MFDTSDSEWLVRAQPARNPKVEVSFLLSENFYIADPNNAAQLQDPRYRVPLAPPAIESPTGLWLNVKQVVGQEQKLAAYYRDLVERFMKLGRSFDESSHYFWMRMHFEWDGGSIGFPWYDTWMEMHYLLGWLDTAEEGADWWDMDQGWETAASRRDQSFYLRQGDGEGEEYANVRIDRDTLLASVRETLDRTPAVISALSACLGTDVWTTRVHGQAVAFGAGDWQPARSGSWLSRLLGSTGKPSA